MTIVLITLLLMGTASAGSTLSVPITIKPFLIGDSAEFTFELNTTNTGEGVLSWNSYDPSIISSISGSAYSEFGSIDVTTESGVPQTFVLKVKADNGITIGKEYGVYLDYSVSNQRSSSSSSYVSAIPNAPIPPVPELNIFTLMIIGFIGLIAIVKYSNKN